MELRDSLCGKSLGQKKELPLFATVLSDGDEGSRIPRYGRRIREPPSMRLQSLSPASVRAFPPFGRRSLRCGIRFVLSA